MVDRGYSVAVTDRSNIVHFVQTRLSQNILKNLRGDIDSL